MTLLLTEIHPFAVKPFIVFGADGRISKNGRAVGRARKLVKVGKLGAAVGYFGLAEVGRKPMLQWLQEWCNRSRAADLESFATELAEELNRAVPARVRTRYISGFHIAGFGSRREPEFWFVRNVQDDRETIMRSYEVREDFQNHDRRHLAPGQHQIYRNGDIRAHVAAWERLDEALAPLLAFPDFDIPKSPEDYGRWTKFKLQVVALFYKRFCRSSIIGSPVDALVIEQGCNPVSV